MTRPSIQHFSSGLKFMNVWDLTYSTLSALPVGDSEDNLGTRAVARQVFVWSLWSRAGFAFHQNLLHCAVAKAKLLFM
jgi:hypothetical protein